MDRRAELLNILKDVEESKKIVVTPLIDDVIFLEGKLTSLKSLPFIQVHPTDKGKQRMTPASKQYKELLQQYNNCIKIILHAIGKDESSEDSPLRAYLKRFEEA